MAGNKFNVSGKLIVTSQEAMTLPKLSTAPSSPVSGDLYFDTTINEIQIYQSGAWHSLSTGSAALAGQALNSKNVIVGNGSNISAAVDTNAVGDILADSTNGLTIKNSVIVNAQVSASAAIALSKLAATTASKVLVSDGSGLISASAVSTTTLGYLDATSSIQTQLDAKATKALSNLASTAINVDLLPGVTDTINVGSTSFAFLSASVKNYKIVTAASAVAGNLQHNVTNASVELTSDDTGGLQLRTTDGHLFIEATKAVSPANVYISTSPTGIVDIDSGYVSIQTGNTSGTAVSGDIHLYAGSNAGTPANSGNFAAQGYTASLSGSVASILIGTDISAESNKIINLATPTANTDATTKLYVDTAVSGAGVGTFIPLSQKGANSGVATLDAGGKVPAAQLPNSVMTYEGTFDASATPATPLLNGDSAANAGMVYLTTIAGSYNFGAGAISFALGDWAVYNGTIWEKSTNSNAVVSVNGSTGTVTVNAINELTGDITAGPASGSQSKAATIASGAVTSAKIASNTIVDSNISTSAAIALSKLAALTASKVLVSDVSGVVSPSSVSTTTLGYLDATSSIQTQLGTKATQALDNLASVAINTDLLPGTDNTISLGSSAKRLTNLFVNSAVKIGSTALQVVFLEPHSVTLTASTSTFTTAATLFAVSGQKSCEIIYEVNDGTDYRSGRIMVATNGTTIGFNDTYADTATIATLEFQVAIDTGSAVLQYKGTSGACTLKFSQRAIV